MSTVTEVTPFQHPWLQLHTSHSALPPHSVSTASPAAVSAAGKTPINLHLLKAANQVK